MRHLTKNDLLSWSPHIYKDIVTGTLYTTNYIDHYNGYMLSPRGLVPFDEVQDVKMNNDDKIGIIIIK